MRMSGYCIITDCIWIYDAAAMIISIVDGCTELIVHLLFIIFGTFESGYYSGGNPTTRCHLKQPKMQNTVPKYCSLSYSPHGCPLNSNECYSAIHLCMFIVAAVISVITVSTCCYFLDNLSSVHGANSHYFECVPGTKYYALRVFCCFNILFIYSTLLCIESNTQPVSLDPICFPKMALVAYFGSAMLSFVYTLSSYFSPNLFLGSLGSISTVIECNLAIYTCGLSFSIT